MNYQTFKDKMLEIVNEADVGSKATDTNWSASDQVSLRIIKNLLSD